MLKCLAIHIGQGPDKLFEPFSVTKKNDLHHSFVALFKLYFTFEIALRVTNASLPPEMPF